jgi:hypothetical protein
MAISAFKYNKLKIDVLEYKLPDIITNVPNPTEDDYKIGYIQRYFIQKANDNTAYIYEVDSSNFLDFQLSPYFKTSTIRWRISGSTDEIRESNSKSIKIGMKEISSLHLYLPNTLQFSKQ